MRIKVIIDATAAGFFTAFRMTENVRVVFLPGCEVDPKQ
jgi:hypothetical protein